MSVQSDEEHLLASAELDISDVISLWLDMSDSIFIYFHFVDSGVSTVHLLLLVRRAVICDSIFGTPVGFPTIREEESRKRGEVAGRSPSLASRSPFDEQHSGQCSEGMDLAKVPGSRRGS